VQVKTVFVQFPDPERLWSSTKKGKKRIKPKTRRPQSPLLKQPQYARKAIVLLRPDEKGGKGNRPHTDIGLSSSCHGWERGSQKGITFALSTPTQDFTLEKGGVQSGSRLSFRTRMRKGRSVINWEKASELNLQGKPKISESQQIKSVRGTLKAAGRS